MRFGRDAGLALVVALLASCEPKVGGVPDVGSLAPDYAATTMTGDTVRTSGLRGQVVLLNVWATWCGPCREEIPFLEQLHRANAPRGLRVIGISTDAPGEDASIRDFARDLGMTYPIWRDPEQRILSLYLSLGTPASYLIDRRGVLRWTHVGVLRATNADFAERLEQALADR